MEPLGVADDSEHIALDTHDQPQHVEDDGAGRLDVSPSVQLQHLFIFNANQPPRQQTSIAGAHRSYVVRCRQKCWTNCPTAHANRPPQQKQRTRPLRTFSSMVSTQRTRLNGERCNSFNNSPAGVVKCSRLTAGICNGSTRPFGGCQGPGSNRQQSRISCRATSLSACVCSCDAKNCSTRGIRRYLPTQQTRQQHGRHKKVCQCFVH